MTHRILTCQAHIHRILLDNGMLDQIKPTNPNNPGCVGMFPAHDTDITSNDGTYYLIDRGLEYTLMILEGFSMEQAYAAYDEFNRQTNPNSDGTHIRISPQDNPSSN